MHRTRLPLTNWFWTMYLCATVQCDDFSSYKELTGISCDAKPFDLASNDLKWLHKSIGNLKDFLLKLTMDDALSCSLILMNLVSVAGTPAISSSSALLGLWLHLVPCRAKPI